MTKSDNIVFRIAEALLLAAAAYLYSYFGNSVLISLFTTVTIGVIAYRKHYLAVMLDVTFMLVSLVAFGILNLNVDITNIVIDLCNLSFTGVVSGVMLKNSKSFVSQISAVSFSELVGALLVLVSVKRGGGDIFEMYVSAPLDAYMQIFTQAIKQSEGYSAEMAEMLSSLSSMLSAAIQMFMPSFFIISAAVVGYFKFTLIKKSVEVLEKKKLSVTAFSNIRLDYKVTLITLAIILFLTFAQKSIFSDALSNILLIMLFVYFVCGFSVLDFYFKKTKLFWWLRLIVYILAIVFSLYAASFLLPAFVLVGMIDSRSDIRRIKKVRCNAASLYDNKEDGKR